ncbi:uncharacterized protein si:ch211-227n13.3 isoform X2 [Acanthochromis polyacanthus]|uniref:uncharacterized protein si:ch211-227n13.3 isoform X2 n=1 Tax=Acanthochromis polyacanthus TaxID=80966 RepID=UPI0022343621|nr:uncharacterized protein si:ch211-227n13.3 isoform X2 [Acanthochromis polyacanthus]
MSNYVKCEESETKCVIHSRYDTFDWDSSAHLLSIRVEYHRSLDYRLRWKTSMCPQRSIRRPKSSERKPQKSPVSDEDVVQRRLKNQRRRTLERKAEAEDSRVDSYDWRQRDVIDVINCTHDAKHTAMEESEWQEPVEITDKGLTESDDDCVSVCSSIASGPSLLHHVTPKKLRLPQDLCSACRKLYQKAKRTKTPIISKLLDIDPKSLTCDQWVLIKSWTPRGLTYVSGKLLCHVQLKKEANVRVGESSGCSRPHAFLQRNLRRCVKVAKKNQKKRNGRKRRRDNSQGSRAAKQQRLHGNSHRQHSSLPIMNDEPGLEGLGPQETNSQSNTDLMKELIPCSVILEKVKPTEMTLRQKRLNPAGRFRDLLTQLQSNRSRIVRETR